jgi:hypothetical protein
MLDCRRQVTSGERAVAQQQVATPVMIVVDTTAELRQVEATCILHGLKQTSVLAAPVYLIRGLIEPNLIPKLAEVPGVRSVERDRHIQFPLAPTR